MKKSCGSMIHYYYSTQGQILQQFSMFTQIKKLIPHHFPLRILYHKCSAIVAALRYGFPAHGMNVIGVTGTDGKTTTSFLVTQLLLLSGKKVGMTTTVGFQILDTYTPNLTHKTTLGRFGLQQMLRKMKDLAVTDVVVEVSSHALDQYRVWGIPFSTGIFTNLSREHLDYHGTMERYFFAKKRLFDMVAGKKEEGNFIINARDTYAQRLLSTPFVRKILFTQGGLPKDLTPEQDWIVFDARNVTSTTFGQSFDLHVGGKVYPSEIGLVGDFNVDNVLAAMAAVFAEGVAVETIIPLLAKLNAVPGRMEEVKSIQGKGRIFIDYAVTPEALTKCYENLRSICKGNLIAVLGACGDRDQGKRPQMGDIATDLCDTVVFTDEESYSEDPREIIRMLVSGVKEHNRDNYEVVEDRREAIERAISILKKDDVLVITGMGDQRSRIVNEVMEPWSDREVVGELLEKTAAYL